MPNCTLTDFARGGAGDYRYLRDQIETYAQQGHSFEFRDCRLLPGCQPAQATVGFWRDRGGYVMYVRPTVAYGGGDSRIRRFFQNGRQGFGSFEDLVDFLKALSPAEPPQQAMPPAPAPGHAAPRACLTDPDQVVLPQAGTKALPDCRILARELEEAVIGQPQAAETVAFKLYTHIGKRCPTRPLSLIFHGPTGVGKSELAKQVPVVLDRHLGKDGYQMVWTDLNTFTEAHSAYRLTGAPPGYVGYEDPPIFEAVVKHPRTVFLFDELEKAHPEVLKLFMGVLDEGRCAARKALPGHGRELDLRQCIFLFTTNLDLGPAGWGGDPERSGDPAGDLAARIFAADEQGRKLLAASGCLREIAGRFSGFVGFHDLDGRSRVSIIAKQVAALASEYGLALSYISPQIIQAIVDQTADGVFSIRSHVGVIEGHLAPFFLSQAGSFRGEPLRLEGTMEQKRLVPAC